MKELTFGVEIEFCGNRSDVIPAVLAVTGGSRSPRSIIDRKGRLWGFVSDSSIEGRGLEGIELVSPVLKYEDIEELQEVVRAIKRSGARVNESCGIHIHVGANSFSTKGICNLIKIVNKQEVLIENSLGICERRKRSYCQSIDDSFVEKIDKYKPINNDQLNRLWFGYYNQSPFKYDPKRYRGVNLNNIWRIGTIEFRWFNSTLHAGKVKAYIQFILALSTKAIKAKFASSKKRKYEENHSKYDFRVFLLRLGFIGDEFKTARVHLMANLKGRIAWKYSSPTK